MEVVLSFKHVGLAYRRTLNPFAEKNWVLKDVSFELVSGEVLGVIGRNGAGKSTLLRLLGDIVSPDKGEIFRRPGLRAQLLTLQLGFNNRLSGLDNAIMSLVTQGKRISEAKNLIDAVIDFAEIDDLIDHPVSTYSSGEKARLGFAIAMQATPDVLLLDEMLGVGDKEFKSKSRQALKQKVISDQTVVLVSHSANTIRDLCDRVVWIESGEVQMQGDVDSVVSAYEDYKKTVTR